jgi:hypothetical protein
MSYFSRAATTIWHWIYWSAAMLFRVIALALVLCVLVPWLVLDFFPKRKSKPLTSPAQPLRLLQIPLREGSEVFVLNPDGAKVPVSRLEAVTQARAWNDVCFGAFVYELPR